MKKVFTAFILLIILLPLTAYAQGGLLNNFLAKEGVSAAVSAAESNGITNPELLFVATVNKTIPVEYQPYYSGDVDVTFNLDDGTSNVWLYIFRSGDNNENKVTIGVVDITIVGIYAMKLTDIEIELPTIGSDFKKSLNDVEWVDSDRMAELFRGDTGLMNFLNDNPNPETQVVGLSVNSAFNFIDMDLVIWSYSVLNDGQYKVCAIDNSTETVICDDILGVEEQAANSPEINISPNPVTDVMTINIPAAVNNSLYQVTVYDSFGRIVKELNTNQQNISIDMSNQAAGVYYYSISGGGEFHKGQIVKL